MNGSTRRFCPRTADVPTLERSVARKPRAVARLRISDVFIARRRDDAARPTREVSLLHARLAAMLSADGDVLALRVHDGVAHVTARTRGHECRLEVDLCDPDAELVLATRLACFVDRVTHAAA